MIRKNYQRRPFISKGTRLAIKQELMQRDGRRCQICKRFRSIDMLTIDHIIPQSKGGSWDLSNLRLACQPCNVARGDEDKVSAATDCHNVLVDEMKRIARLPRYVIINGPTTKGPPKWVEKLRRKP